jgi:hypothetical protein
MEEITDRFVEIALDCENGELWYRVITYNEDGSTDTTEKFLGGIVGKRIGEVLESLGSTELETMIEETLLEEQKEK